MSDLKKSVIYSARRFQKSDEVIHDLPPFKNTCTCSAKQSMILALALGFLLCQYLLKSLNMWIDELSQV